MAVIIGGIIAYTLSIPHETETPPPPAVVEPCDLLCIVDERTALIYERDQSEYRKQARLKALIEIQGELQLITLEYKN